MEIRFGAIKPEVQRNGFADVKLGDVIQRPDGGSYGRIIAMDKDLILTEPVNLDGVANFRGHVVKLNLEA